MRTIKISEFWEALKANGHPWGGGMMYNSNTKEFCALGQVTKNLGYGEEDVNFRFIGYDLHSAVLKIIGVSLTHINDSVYYNYTDEIRTYEHVVDLMEPYILPHLDKEISFEDYRND